MRSPNKQTLVYGDARRFLAEQAKHRSLVPFIGAGVSVGAGLPGWNSLLKPLIEEMGIRSDPEEHLDPLDLAQWYADSKGRKALLQHVRSALSAAVVPGEMHRALAKLPAPVLVTTNYDALMERAVAEAQGVPPDVIVEDRHVAMIDEARRTTLVKLHGCLSLPETIVLARDDYEEYENRHRATITYLQSLLATRTFLFVGFSLADPNFRQIHQAIRRALGTYRKEAYLLDARPWPQQVVDYWRQRGMKILLFEDYGRVTEFIQAIGQDGMKTRTVEEATEILAGPPPIEVERLIDHLRSLRTELERVMRQAQGMGLMPAEGEDAVDAAPIVIGTDGDAGKWISAKARALLDLTAAVDRLTPIEDPGLWIALGDMLYTQGDGSGAISAYHTALRPGGNNRTVVPSTLMRARGNLARVLAREGQYPRAEWLFRHCVFQPGEEVSQDGIDRDSVFRRMALEHLRQRPTDAAEFAYVVTRRAEELREAGHFKEALDAVTEARYVLGPVLGVSRDPAYRLDYFQASDHRHAGWSRFSQMRAVKAPRGEHPLVARAYALNFFGKCYRLSCHLTLDLRRSSGLYHLKMAEENLREVSRIDPLLPYPYAHRLLLYADQLLPYHERRRILDSVRADLALLERMPQAAPMLKMLRDQFDFLDHEQRRR